MRERKRVTAIIASRYQRVQKRHKGIMLNEFVALTRYTRSYATYVLRAHGNSFKVSEDTIIKGDVRKRVKRRGKKSYDGNVKKALTKIWAIMDCICGKRLALSLKEVTRILQRYNEIKLDPVTRKKLYKISAATRILKSQSKREGLLVSTRGFS